MKYDGIVVGGGAAGMFAALIAAQQGNSVLLIDKNDQLGRKLLITGKGRCNVTNACSASDVLQNVPRNGRFLYSAMNAFPPQSVMDFFESCGCILKIERGNRVFPVSDRAVTVRDCLKTALVDAGVDVQKGTVKDILISDGQVNGVKLSDRNISADWVILATGGLSYPTTGSTGDGFRIAGKHGHTVTPTEGSLVPLESADLDCSKMQGLSLRNVGVRLTNGTGKTVYKDFGELLFTHFGVSGPTVLSASAHIKEFPVKLEIDLKPAIDVQKLDARLLRDLEQYKNRSMENALVDILPRSMIPVILEKALIPVDMQANSLKKEQRKKLIELMKAFPVVLSAKRPVAEAIITSGGIKISEIDPKTMESKIVSGLFFAGEIIDCDAYTGGFNLQIAWATAYAAGMAVKNHH